MHWFGGGYPYNLVNYCEIDKYASKAYSQIHNVSEELNLWDITKVDEQKLVNKGINLITYGFPCTDISMAGQQKGFWEKNGEKTRSGLFFDALRVIKAVKPSVCIAENVKALTSKKFRKEFDIVLSSLEVAGYNNHVAVLNAKDYGIPQNRERVFIISVRKDIDMCFFEWPEKQELKFRLKDLLEDEVDEKYFCKSERALNIAKALTEKYQNKITGQPVIVGSVQKNAMTNNTGISPCLTCRMGESGGNTPMIIDEGGERGRVISPNGVSPCLSATDYKDPVKIVDGFNTNTDGNAFCLTAHYSRVAPTNFFDCVSGHRATGVIHNGVIRKLTPRECWRLMGFTDTEFDKASIGTSNSQLYKMAGNSIVVNVLEAIFRKLFKQVKL